MMRVLQPSRTLLAPFLAALLLGCVAKPPESPIVLNAHQPDHRQARAAPPRRPAVVKSLAGTSLAANRAVPVPPPAVSAASPSIPVAAQPLPPPADAEELSPDAKTHLFQDFDDYLAKSGHEQ